MAGRSAAVEVAVVQAERALAAADSLDCRYARVTEIVASHDRLAEALRGLLKQQPSRSNPQG